MSTTAKDLFPCVGQRCTVTDGRFVVRGELSYGTTQGFTITVLDPNRKEDPHASAVAHVEIDTTRIQSFTQRKESDLTHLIHLEA